MVPEEVLADDRIDDLERQAWELLRTSCEASHGRRKFVGQIENWLYWKRMKELSKVMDVEFAMDYARGYSAAYQEMINQMKGLKLSPHKEEKR